MSDDAPKTAIELAMERLRKKDADEGVVDRPLSEEQKAKIAEIKSVYAARLAQEEIIQKSKLATIWEPEERAKLEDGHRREMQHIQEERDRKIAKVRG